MLSFPLLQTYRTTYDEIFTVDLLEQEPMVGVDHVLRQTVFLKNSVRHILSYFWFHILYFAKNLSYRFLFYFAWMLSQTHFLIPEILSWGHKT